MTKDFENVSHFLRYLDKNKRVNPSSRTLTSTDDWSGVESWKEFEQYLENGNPDITAEVRKYSKLYIDQFQEMFVESTQYMFDVVGEFFDIGAVMVGEPEAWIKEIVVKDDKFIELNIQGTYCDGTNLTEVRKNGAKVFAIATILEQQGFLVRINMIYASGGSNTANSKEITRVSIKVKDYDQTLDYKKFGILLGVPFFRRGFLRLLEIEYGENCAHGYGFPHRTDGEINLDQTKDIVNLEKMLKNEKVD